MPPDATMYGAFAPTHQRKGDGLRVRVIQVVVTLAFAAALVIAGLASDRARASSFDDTAIASAPRTPAEMNGTDPSPMRVQAVQGADAEDAAVTANVKNAIAASIGPGAAQINVETRAAVVTLSGEVASAAIRDRAREAAWIVSGVVDVVDRIVVKSTG